MENNNSQIQYNLDFDAELPSEGNETINPDINETVDYQKEQVKDLLNVFNNDEVFFETVCFKFLSNWVDKGENWENHIFYLNVLSNEWTCTELKLQIDQYWKIEWFNKNDLPGLNNEETNPLQKKLDSVKLLGWLKNDTSERKKFISKLFLKNWVPSKQIAVAEKKDNLKEPETIFQLWMVDKVKRVLYYKYPGNISKNEATVHIKIWNTLFRVSKLKFNIIKPDPRDPDDTDNKIFIKTWKSKGKNKEGYRVSFYDSKLEKWRLIDEHNHAEMERDILESVEHVLINEKYNPYI